MVHDEPTTLNVNGRAVPLRFRHNSRARRLILRLDPTNDGAVVTLPSGADSDDGFEFAQRNLGWLAERLESAPPAVPFRDGAVVPYMGEMHAVIHRPDERGTAHCDEGEIFVFGAIEHLGRRLTDWLRREARRELTEKTQQKSEELGRDHGRITIRDTRSRWGSCAANGDLSFSWRLIMAPESVLDYVVAHEVAHLEHHNHSRQFWDAVAGLTDDVEAPRKWLRANGGLLHRYG